MRIVGCSEIYTVMDCNRHGGLLRWSSGRFGLTHGDDGDYEHGCHGQESGTVAVGEVE